MNKCLSYMAQQNVSDEEQQQYSALYDKFVDIVEKLNKLRKELECSKHDLNFWYNKQKNTKLAVSKNYSISIYSENEHQAKDIAAILEKD